MSRKYLFLDAGALKSSYDLLARDLEEATIRPELRKIALGFERIFYYDAIPSQRDGEADIEYNSRVNQVERELTQIGLLPYFHVRTGTAKYRKRLKGMEQKGVDVLMAVDLLKFAFQRQMDEAWIWSSDLDMFPAISALTETRVKSVLLYSPQGTSAELTVVADDAAPLVTSKLLYWCSDSSLAEKHGTQCYGDVRSQKGASLKLLRVGSYRGERFELYRDTKADKIMGFSVARDQSCYALRERAVLDQYYQTPLSKVSWNDS